MAIYHLSAKVVSRGRGQSAVAAAAYRSGERLQDEQSGEQKFYEQRARRIVFTDIMAPRHAPAWAHDRNRLWNEAERAEKRKDAQLAREIEVSLPHELTEQQREYLVKDFAREAFVRRGYVVDIAIHQPDRGGDLRNHHAHLMITMRVIGPDGFAPMKDRTLNSTEQLEAWRVQWANLANRHLARHGHEARVDHRSLEAQGIDREPTTHVGYAGSEMAARGAQSDRIDALKGVQARNGMRAELRATDEELARLQQLAANENRKLRKAPERARESVPMREPPTDEELRKQLEKETTYLKHFETQHRKAQAELEAQRRAQETDQRAKAYLAAKEQEAEEGRKKKAAQEASANDIRNGDISSAAARYSIAIGENYDVRDPYASLARAAGAESAAFHRTQEQLKAAAAKETDPDKRKAIELRRQIEGCDYMAITSDRLASISETVTGRYDNAYAVEDRQKAADFRALGKTLREERSAALDVVQAKEAAEKEQAQQRTGRPARDAASLDGREPTRTHYRTEMPAQAPEPEKPAEQSRGKGDSERAGEGSAMPAPRRRDYQVLTEAANDPGPSGSEHSAELRVVDRDGRDAGPLSAFMQREQPRASEAYKAPGMGKLLNDEKAWKAHQQATVREMDTARGADKALGRLGGDLEKGRTVQAEDLRSLTREQWDGVRSKGEAGLIQQVREAQDRGAQDHSRGMGRSGPRPWEP